MEEELWSRPRVQHEPGQRRDKLGGGRAWARGRAGRWMAGRSRGQSPGKPERMRTPAPWGRCAGGAPAGHLGSGAWRRPQAGTQHETFKAAGVSPRQSRRWRRGRAILEHRSGLSPGLNGPRGRRAGRNHCPAQPGVGGPPWAGVSPVGHSAQRRRDTPSGLLGGQGILGGPAGQRVSGDGVVSGNFAASAESACVEGGGRTG